MEIDRILLFGDSLTQFSFDSDRCGWGAYLQNAFVRRLDVVQRGYGGYNSEHGKHMLKPILESILPPKTRTRLVVIFFGANDAATNFQGIPVEHYKQNLLDMVQTIRKCDAETHVLLISPPPIHEGLWEKHMIKQGGTLNRHVERTRLFRDTCLEAGREAGVPVLDMWKVFFQDSAEYNADSAKRLLLDGLHFTSKANRLLGKAVLETIAKQFPEMNPETMKWQMPYWKDIDNKALPESLFR
ncbi:hypothetical protein PhCBS80983_g05049 [Powellomyces hirtus]|uniref:SGNH hydrolase-type esterase domain-containing protein n=1 Tax=Powellomyces hirtus TaxID=109895 RepID=A0A507DVL7_9FUNG|nr:hypothetical protein PhCBS80983_g05049 [Powellomyces hirtus]